MLTSQDLLGRGWTKTAIGKWLWQPDYIEAFHIRGRGPCTRHWYDAERVEAVEATADWQAFAEKRAARSAAAKKAATTRHANTVAWADQVEIRIDLDDFDWAELEELALDAQSAWECERGHTGDVHGAPEHVKHRWTMNYIRHELLRGDPRITSGSHWRLGRLRHDPRSDRGTHR